MISMPEQTTDALSISVDTEYLINQSSPDEDKFVFSYTISIKNVTDTTMQLLNRHWLITDANGEVTEVRGEGVIGQQPHITSGENFTYSSGCILKTPLGTMQGFYHLKAPDGTDVKAEIPVFRLAIPNILN